MKSLKAFLIERYVNIIGDEDLKRKYADQVWDILQKSYAAIGGIKGNGFASKEDMIKNIPFWKLAVQNGKVEAAVMYKDKGGRKSVAMGTTGSTWGKTRAVEMIKADLSRSYGEKSKGSLGLLLKQFPEDVISQFLHTPKEVAKIAGDDIITPLVDVDQKDWPADAKLTVSKYPFIKKYGYFREINGNQIFKVMVGTPNKAIRL